MNYPDQGVCTSLTQCTVASEIERLYKILSEVESKIFPPCPSASASLKEVSEKEVSENNLISIRNDISSIADRLNYINESLTFIGK